MTRASASTLIVTKQVNTRSPPLCCCWMQVMNFNDAVFPLKKLAFFSQTVVYEKVGKRERENACTKLKQINEP